MSFHLETRRACLAILKDDDDLTTLVAASSIYPQSPPAAPAWPFIRYGAPAGTPITGACLAGQEVTFALHAFAKDRIIGTTTVESAEDHAARIGKAMTKAIDKRTADITDGRIRFRVTGDQLLQDGAEAGAYHFIANIRARVMA